MLASSVLWVLLAQTPISDPAPNPAPPDRPNEQPSEPAREAGAQDAPTPAASPLEAQVTPRVEGTVPALAWDGTPPKDAAELGELLARFSAAWPRSFRTREVGRSRRGGAVWLGTVTRAAVADDTRVPTLLHVPPPTPTRDALGRALNACAGLLERAEADAALADRLATSAVQFLFAPDPDRVFGAETLAPHFDYPVGWNGTAALPFPLFEPESRAVAAYLARTPEVGLCVFEGAVEGGAPLYGAQAGAFAPGGTLARFVRGYLGAGLLVHAPIAEREAHVLVLANELTHLPRLVSAPVAIERVRSDHWIVEVPVRNEGRVATLEGAAVERERSSVWAVLVGAELAAVARAETRDGAVFEPLNVRAGALELGHLSGGEGLRLRLILRGVEGTEAKLVVRSLRAGGLDIAIGLR